MGMKSICLVLMMNLQLKFQPKPKPLQKARVQFLSQNINLPLMLITYRFFVSSRAWSFFFFSRISRNSDMYYSRGGKMYGSCTHVTGQNGCGRVVLTQNTFLSKLLFFLRLWKLYFLNNNLNFWIKEFWRFYALKYSFKKLLTHLTPLIFSNFFLLYPLDPLVI